MELNRTKIEISENTKAIALKAIGRGGTRDNWLILISHVKMSRQDDEEIFTVYRHISFNLSNHETFTNLTNNGKFLLEFSDKLCEFFGVDNCLPLSNGHMALEMTIQAFGFEPGK